MSARQKIAGSVNGALSGTTSANSAASANPSPSIRAEKFSGTDTMTTLAQKLTRMQTAITESARGLSNPHATSQIFWDLTVGQSGALVTLTHKLNRRVGWTVVDWTPASGSGVWSLERDVSDNAIQTADTLYLRSRIAGVISIEVFG